MAVVAKAVVAKEEEASSVSSRVCSENSRVEKEAGKEEGKEAVVGAGGGVDKVTKVAVGGEAVGEVGMTPVVVAGGTGTVAAEDMEIVAACSKVPLELL